MPRTAAVLDDRRLGKQRVETLQILRALHVEDYGWASHPAVTMWRGHTTALVTYGTVVVDEWVARGHRDGTRDQIVEFVHPRTPPSWTTLARTRDLLPPWWGREDLHRSHRSALLRKDPEHYGRRLPATPDDLDYVWPDPPGEVPPRGERVAWVVRSEVDDDTITLPLRPGELLRLEGATRPGRPAKRHRQVVRFAEELAEGDTVVVPAGGELHVGRLTSRVHADPDALRRGVDWIGAIARTALDRPAQLQDPQAVFTLRDEPTVTHLARGGQAGPD